MFFLADLIWCGSEWWDGEGWDHNAFEAPIQLVDNERVPGDDDPFWELGPNSSSDSDSVDDNPVYSPVGGSEDEDDGDVASWPHHGS